MEDVNKILISICIPVYNREEYLKECLLSVLAQNLHDSLYEILIYDDASTDGSKQIINTFVKENPARNIKEFYGEHNMGLWHARNALYDKACGKYILCLDADDKLAPGILKRLVEVANAKNPDMVIFPYSEISAKGEITRTIDSKLSEITSKSINRFPIDTYHFSVWNKLIRRELIAGLDIKVPEGINCWEDLSVTARIYTQAEKIIVLHDVGYYYRKHDTGAYTAHNHKKILEQHIACTDFLEEWFNDNRIAEEYRDFLNHLKFATKIKMLRGDTMELKRWKKSYPETNSSIMSMPGIALHYKILFKLLSLI